MSRIKVHKTGIAQKDGREGTDLTSGEKYPLVAVKTTEVIKVEDIKRLLAEEPGASVQRLLELTK